MRGPLLLYLAVASLAVGGFTFFDGDASWKVEGAMQSLYQRICDGQSKPARSSWRFYENALALERNNTSTVAEVTGLFCAWRLADDVRGDARASGLVPFLFAQLTPGFTDAGLWQKAALYHLASRSPASSWKLHFLSCQTWLDVGSSQNGLVVSALSAFSIGELDCFGAVEQLAQSHTASSLADAGHVLLTLADAYRAHSRPRSAALRYISALAYFDASAPATRWGWHAYVASAHLMSMLIAHGASASMSTLHYVARSWAMARRAQLLIGVAAFRTTLLPSLGLWTSDHDAYHVAVRASLAASLRLLGALRKVQAWRRSGGGSDSSPSHALAILVTLGFTSDALGADLTDVAISELRRVLLTGLHELSRLEATFHDTPAWFPMLATLLHTVYADDACADCEMPVRDASLLLQGVPTSRELTARWPSLPQRRSRGIAAAHASHLRASRASLRFVSQLRLAYVSGDFRRHAIGYSMHGVLASHDRSRVSTACYHTAGFDAVIAVHSIDALNASAPFNVADGDCWGKGVDLREWWDARVRPLLGASASRGSLNTQFVEPSPGAPTPMVIDAQLGDPFYSLHTPRLVESCDAFYAPLLWHGGARWSADEVAAHLKGEWRHVPVEAHRTAAHVAVDVSGLTQAGAAEVFTHPSGIAPIRVHYMSGPLSVLHPRHAHYMIMDATVMPPDLAWSSVPECLPHALGLRRSGSMELDGCEGRGAPRYVTLPTFSESPVYLPPTFLASTYPTSGASPFQTRRCGCDASKPGGTAPRLAPLTSPVLAAFLPASKIEPELYTAWIGLMAARSPGRPPPAL